MAEVYSFFDPVLLPNGLPDRDYNAQEFTDYFGDLVTTGVMKGVGAELKVTANGSNMVVEIDTGTAFVEDKRYANTAKLAHTLDTETLGKDRIDRVVIRKDLNTDARWVKSFIKKGVPSANPVPPALTQTETVYEISLAQVKVIGGQTYISASNVTDERGKPEVCPWAGSNILPNFDDAELEDLVHKVDNLGTPLEFTGDLNELTVSGFYSVNSPTNIPSGFYGLAFVEVMASTDGLYVIQIFMYNNNPTAGGVFSRTRSDGIWGPWTRIDTHLNDTLTSSSKTEAATANAVRQVNDKFSKAALGAGANAPNEYAVAVGVNSKSALRSVAMGYGANASVNQALALGAASNALNPSWGILGVESQAFGGPAFWEVPGTFSVKGTKNFEIPHPAPHKKGTHVIRHGAVESPTAGDTLYRYTVEAHADGETVELQLPDYFQYLNKDVDVWVNGDGHFGRAFGRVEGGTLYVTCELAGSYKALVIGTRNDDHESVQTWDIRGVEREVGESWTGEAHSYEVDEILEIQEITQGVA